MSGTTSRSLKIETFKEEERERLLKSSFADFNEKMIDRHGKDALLICSNQLVCSYTLILLQPLGL